MADTEQPDVTAFTVQLLSAYLANNEVAHTELAELIRTTRQALVGEPAASTAESGADANKPAVSVRKSLASPDFILSLIDGKPYKTLKRHLTTHGLTPQAYRERYKLPADYPIVAPGFAAQRRLIANKIELGRRLSGHAAIAAQPPEQSPAPSVSAAPAPAPATTPVTAPDVVKTRKARISKSAAPTQSATKADAKAVKRGPKPKAVAPAIDALAPQTEQPDAQPVSVQTDVSELPVTTAKAAATGQKAAPKPRQRGARGTLKLFANDPSDQAIAQDMAATPTTVAKPKTPKAKPAATVKAPKAAKKPPVSDAPEI